MKRYLIFFVALCTSLSCTKTVLKTENEFSGTKFYYAEVPSEDSKTYIDTDYEIHWTADDRISVFCSPSNEQYRFTGATGDWKGTFENLTEPAIPTYSRNYAVYPYQGDNTSGGEGSITVTLPSVQNYAEKSFGLGANTMVAVTESLADDNFKFLNCCGYLMLKLYGGDRIKSITLRGNSGEKIAGLATITATYGESPTIAMEDDATTEITLICPAEGVPTNESEESFTQFWIALPPTTFSNGFTIDVTNTADDIISRSTSNSVTINRNKILKMVPVKVDSQSSKDLLSFSLSDGINTYDAFDISDGYVNVQVPNGTDMTAMTATFEHNGVSVKVNGVPQTSGADSHNFSDFVHPLTYVVTSKAGASQSYVIRMFNLPLLFVDTPDKQPVTSKTVWIEGADCKLYDTSNNLLFSGKTSIKGRGNSSWGYSKKPYALKLEKSQSFFGMPKGKRWCLLANWWGAMCNPVGHEISRRCEGIDWSPRGEYVELFLNGEYLGCYDLREQIKIQDGRVNIQELKSDDIDDETITGGYLLTYDNTWDEVNKFHSQYFNMPVMFKDPDEDVLVQAQFDYLQNYINNFEASLEDKSRLDALEYLQYIDLDSFVDIWFVKEMASSSDYCVPRSAWFHKDRNGKLVSGPTWDFDQCTFSSQKLVCTNAIYYGTLFKSAFFVSRVKERWPAFKAHMLGDEHYASSIMDYANGLYTKINKTDERDRIRWTRPSSSSIETQIEKMTNGIPLKLEWLEDYINSLVVDYDSLRVRGKSMCLGIDVLKSEEEVFDIGYTSQLGTEVLDFGVEGFRGSIR